MIALARRAIESFSIRSGLRKLINRTGTARIGGVKFLVPVIYGSKLRSSEDWMLDVLRQLFALRSGAFVDVGVNLGQTLLKVAAIDRTRPYIGFEPNPTCVTYAERLIAANGLHGYSVVPAGLSDRTGVVTLHLKVGESTDSAATIIPNFRSDPRIREEKNVVVLSIGDLPRGMIPDDVAVVKIDVEGAELQVLSALLPVLRRCRPFIVIEVLPAYTAENAPRVERQKRLEELVRRLDYRMYRIRRDRNSLERLEPIQSIGIHGDLGLTDYVFAPSEYVERLCDGTAECESSERES